MFTVNEDLSIYATRGDVVFFSVTAYDGADNYTFKAGDVVRFKVFGKKDAENVLLQKDFPVTEECEEVEIFLEKEDTKIGEVISKHKDYWYEVELNPNGNAQTIIGYDEDGAKVFRLFPEGDDVPPFVPDPEDIAVMDTELDMTSDRPVQNQAIARAVVSLRADFEKTRTDITEKSNDTANVAAATQNEVAVERARIDNLVSHSVTSYSKTLDYLDFITEETKAKIDGRVESDGVFATIKVNLREANLIYGGTTFDVFIIPNECRPVSVGMIHTEDGLEYRINYDNANKRYYLSLLALDAVAPSGAGTVTMEYALGIHEVVDLRVDVDGNTHASAGEAVRAQISALGSVSSVSLLSVPCELGGVNIGYDAAAGTNVYHNQRFRTVGYIRVNSGTVIKSTGTIQFGVQELDKNYAFLKDSGWLNAGTSYTVENDGYIKICGGGYPLIDFTDNMDTHRAGIHIYFAPSPDKSDEIIHCLNQTNAVYGEDSWKNHFWYNGTLMEAAHRIGTKVGFIPNVDIKVKVTSDTYRFGVIEWNGTEYVAANFMSDSGWVSEAYLEAGHLYTIAMKRMGDGTIRTHECRNLMVVTCPLKKDVDELKKGFNELREVIPTSESFAYVIDGIPVNVKKQKYSVDRMAINAPPTTSITVGNVGAQQGMTICNGVIFQLYSDNVLVLMDYATGGVINQLKITSAHGDTLDFSNEYYAEGDEFPLAYITADSNPARVYVVRITRTSAEYIKMYTFPLDKTGYYAGHSLDPLNKIIYQIGYTEASYYADLNGTNYMIVSAWDLKDVTDNGDGTFTPRFMKSFRTAFIRTMQGQAYFNGLIACVSSHNQLPTNSEIYFIDPDREKIVSVLSEFPENIKTSLELEGIAFVEEANEYCMVLVANGGAFFKVRFN